MENGHQLSEVRCNCDGIELRKEFRERESKRCRDALRQGQLQKKPRQLHISLMSQVTTTIKLQRIT